MGHRHARYAICVSVIILRTKAKAHQPSRPRRGFRGEVDARRDAPDQDGEVARHERADVGDLDAGVDGEEAVEDGERDDLDRVLGDERVDGEDELRQVGEDELRAG